MKSATLILSILSCFSVVADPNEATAWQDFGQSAKSIANDLLPQNIIKYRHLILDEALLKHRLNTTIKSQIDLPLPDQSLLRVVATPSRVMTPEMSESYPELKTWTVTGVDNPDIKGTIDFTTNGFHGMLMMPDGDTIFIDPDKDQAEGVYKSFSKTDNASAFDVAFNCSTHDAHSDESHLDATEFVPGVAARALDDSDFPNVSIANIRTYLLALSATAEYTANRGGVAGARSSMVTSINRINLIFERDLGVSLNLINAPNLIFSDAASDPFTSPDNVSTLFIENGTYLSAQGLLGSFDIGHVLSRSTFRGGSGVAILGTTCVDSRSSINGIKATGASTSSSPFGETFDLELLAHEFGHQLGAEHSFNSANGGNCSQNRSSEGGVAVEPGSGSSIMAYSGLCGSDNLPNNPFDAFFHFASISQINSYTRGTSGGSCGSLSNNILRPTVSAGSDLRIPANTPFLLDGTVSGGSTASGRTTSWDQIDIGDASRVDVDNGQNAIIRHLIPTAEQDRYIPRLADLFAGTNSIGEIVPTTTRQLNFAYVVRDGGAAGAIVSDKKLINVSNTGSAFSVTSQAFSQSFITNRTFSINWNVADTNQTPISCSDVDIQLIRTDGVKNMLLASTTNDGSESITIPDATPIMSDARVFVACSDNDNSFFNISSASVSVQQGTIDGEMVQPVITVNGQSAISIVEGTSYTDEGASAIDNVDGAVSVLTIGSVDSNTAGTYIIYYSATDAAGNNQTAVRTVNVTALSLPPVTDSGGGSLGYLLISLIILLGLRRPKLILASIK